MSINELQHIHQLIQRYFDAETTLTEERELRRLVAPLAGSKDPEIQEVRAVLGYLSAAPRKQKRSHSRWVAIGSVAAAIAVVAIIGVKLIFGNDSPSECYAYVGIERITDRAAVEESILNDLEVISEASEDIDNDINTDLQLMRDAFQSTQPSSTL